MTALKAVNVSVTDSDPGSETEKQTPNRTGHKMKAVTLTPEMLSIVRNMFIFSAMRLTCQKIIEACLFQVSDDQQNLTI